MHDFDRIYAEFQPRVLRYLTHLAGENDAQDLTQAVFLKISRALGQFRNEATLSTWIYRIATNTALDHARSSSEHQRRRELLLDDETSLDDFPDENEPGTDRSYLRREMNDCIRGVIKELPENYRTVLLLSEFEELTNGEIATTLNLSLDTVKVRLHRGRSALRKAMEAQCSFYRDERNELMCDRKEKINAGERILLLRVPSKDEEQSHSKDGGTYGTDGLS